MLGNFLLQAGRLDEALRVYDAISTEVPKDSGAFFGAADVYKRRGDFVRAAAARRKAYELDGDEESAKVFTRAATSADYAKAELTLAKANLHELQQQLAIGEPVSAFDLARAHAQVGNREEALTRLQALADDAFTGLTLLKVDQAWDSVRGDPRFSEVVRRIGIP
jgi:tetratricopeptide (TPR) repeat protein